MGSKVKIFISQAMRGLSKEEIAKVRDQAIIAISEEFNHIEEVTVLDSLFDFDESKPPLYYLSKSIEVLSGADVALFIGDISNTRGCKIEYQCAKEYGKIIMNFDLETGKCVEETNK